MDTRKNLIARHFGLRGVSLFEAGKGVLAFAVGVWLLSLRHKDLEDVAQHLLHFLHKTLHLSPDGHIARSIMHGAARVNHNNIFFWALLAFAYTAIRFTEATGLWLEREWAEWFAVISGSIYTPYLIWEVIRHPNIFSWGGLILNVLIVLYLIWLLRDSHRDRKGAAVAVEKETAPPQESV
jgi:uncharacterized membrane protein (DUF2068 family)